MHTKYENNSSTGSWDMPKYVFSTIGDLVSEVKGQGKFWHHDIIDTSNLISEYQRESVKWIHCWNNWDWTLSFSWIWPYRNTLGKYKMVDISKTRKIWETTLTVEITLMDLDKMDIVTWHKFSRFRFVPQLLTDDDGRRTTTTDDWAIP